MLRGVLMLKNDGLGEITHGGVVTALDIGSSSILL